MTKKQKIERLKADYDLQTKISVENAIKVLMDNGNLFFEDYEGKVSPITYCEVKDDKIIFKE